MRCKRPVSKISNMGENRYFCILYARSIIIESMRTLRMIATWRANKTREREGGEFPFEKSDSTVDIDSTVDSDSAVDNAFVIARVAGHGLGSKF